MPVEAFIRRWSESGASERANKDLFLTELCDLLGLTHPDVATGDPARDRYVFEADAIKRNAGRANSIGKMDLYKEGCFIFEAKQGSDTKSKKRGTARRETPQWAQEMNAAYGQALGYAQTLDQPPVFLIACDIGWCFDLYACFDGSRQWRPFPTPLTSRIFLKELDAGKLELLRSIWTDPKALDPSIHAAEVTREVASHLADLARSLERDGHAGERIAAFLMRCLFTMFAEDVGLLPDKLFQKALKELWIPNPPAFAGGLRELWRAMNEGSQFGFVGKLLKFNGGLLKDQDVLPLQREHLLLLLEAALCDWSHVEPSIFGTLLERALDPKERHRLGAHYTPRAYVERLVRPTIEEPLREEWTNVQLEVRTLIRAEPPKGAKASAQREKDQKKREAQARELVRTFHKRLCGTRVLDPACGTGNFLYVTLDLFKRLEGEILQALHDLGDSQALLHMEELSVTPKQFLGIEVKPWAKEIAELVLWIGYLQWNFKTRRKGEMPPEPILRDYHNIECRDALLTWDGEPELARDERGVPISRWDAESYRKSPVTGQDIPDESKRVPIYTYRNPRRATWPEAELIVGNPPFLGKLHFLRAFGPGYAEALRALYPDVPDSVDLVMYWWHRAAALAARKSIRRFGFITTNSIVQAFNRRVVQTAIEGNPPISLVFAIADHPWVDDVTSAAVRIAMSVGEGGARDGALGTIHRERPLQYHREVDLEYTRGRIHADLSIGADVARAHPLMSNSRLASMGPALGSRGFVLAKAQAEGLIQADGAALRPYLKPLRNGRDLLYDPRGVYAIDLQGIRSADDLVRRFPACYQHVHATVFEERKQNNDPKLRTCWWLFRRTNRLQRATIAGLRRFLVTVETAKHRTFMFLESDHIAEHGTITFGFDDAYYCGVMSSRIHGAWTLATGGTLEDRPRYNKVLCFDPFPFPIPGTAARERIRELGELLDAHRKKQQAAHPGLTITGMYNVLAKLRSGEPLTEKERLIHEQGLVSVLKQIHDELDAAVFDAYGWPGDLSDEQILERLVALNAARAEEERRGLVRWLRPELQNPTGGTEAPLMARDGAAEVDAPDPEVESLAPWPKKRPEQIRAIRDLVVRGGTWTAAHVAASFKSAAVTEVTSLLDDIEATGLLVSWDEEGTRSWESAARAA